jgi:hypothetical protein
MNNRTQAAFKELSKAEQDLVNKKIERELTAGLYPFEAIYSWSPEKLNRIVKSEKIKRRK